MGVPNNSGAIASTRIPVLASSRAAGNVIAATPPFDAEYAAWPICPSKAAMEAVLTISRVPMSQGLQGLAYRPLLGA